MKQLLEHARIIAAKDGAFYPIENGFLGIDGDAICYIGSTLPEDADTYDTRKNMSGKLLLPGLINCHCHSPMVLLRGVGSDLCLQEWLFDKIFPVEDRLETIEGGIKVGSELAILEMLASGVTSFTDMYMQPESTCEAVLASGMKANLCRPVQCFVDGESFEDNYRAQQAIELFDRYHMAGNGNIRIDFCIHAEYTCKDHITRKVSEVCRDRGARMHIHLSETKKEHEECKQKFGMTPAEYFLAMGTFENPTTAAHCVWAEPKDLEIFLEKGVTAVHNPTSNMKLGSGFAPVPEMLARGVNVAIGTDGAASNNNLDMLEEMHLAAILHNGYHNDPTLVTPAELLRMATVNGAKCQGREDTGALTVGKKADIVAIDLSKPHMQPAFDPIVSLAYQVQSADVCMTMVNGKILYENGVYLTMDIDRIYHDYQQVLTKLYGE
ncbi:MAG: amidohydrolase [Clostridia bacterium]|nr:amidohydrolase [Clostridia bacterium]